MFGGDTSKNINKQMDYLNSSNKRYILEDKTCLKKQPC